jgi:hypothetical protein
MQSTVTTNKATAAGEGRNGFGRSQRMARKFVPTQCIPWHVALDLFLLVPIILHSLALSPNNVAAGTILVLQQQQRIMDSSRTWIWMRMICENTLAACLHKKIATGLLPLFRAKFVPRVVAKKDIWKMRIGLTTFLSHPQHAVYNAKCTCPRKKQQPSIDAMNLIYGILEPLVLL